MRDSRMRSLVTVPLCAVLLLGSLSACSSADAQAETQSSEEAAPSSHTVTTAYGEVEVPSDPQRVVAVSYNTPWQLEAVDITPVAMQDYSAFADSFTAEQQELIAGMENTVGGFFELNVEAVMAAKPDLIVGDVLEIDEKTFQELSKIAPTAIFEGESRGDWRTIGAGVAEAVGRTEVFEQSRSSYDAELARIKSTYAQVLEQPWAAIASGDVEGGFSTLYPGGEVGALFFDDLGANLAASIPEEAEGDRGWMYISPELTTSVLDGAEIIVAAASADGELPEDLAGTVKSKLFTDLPAAKNGNVYQVYSSVTDYATASDWLSTVERDVLQPASAK